MRDPDACEQCGEPCDDDIALVEAFEVTGRILCDGCAETAFHEAADEGAYRAFLSGVDAATEAAAKAKP